MKKRFLLIVMCVALIAMSLTACKSKEEDKAPTPIPTATTTPTADPTNEVTAEPTEEVKPTDEITETPTETATPTEDVTVVPTEEITAEPTEEVTPEPTDEVTPEPTEEVTPEPTVEVTPEPTEEVTPEPTAEPTEVKKYSYKGLEFEFPAKNNKYFEKLLAVGLTNHDYDGTYIGFVDGGAVVMMNNSNEEVYYQFGDFEKESLENRDPAKWAEYSDDWYQEYLLFKDGTKMCVDLDNDEKISDIELYICIDFSLGMKKSMNGLSTY